MSNNRPSRSLQEFALRSIARYQESPFRHNLMRSPRPVCKFEVSCSVYASRAILAHGFFVGGTLTAIRLLVCALSPRSVSWPAWLNG
jgi:putative component of membrane protein insertase Oxa1/YidC/SpoIIIJ protein YidD